MAKKILGISLSQPWATLLAYGVKEWETRQWRRDYEGIVAIHATNSFPAEARLFAATKRITGLLAAYTGVESVNDLPRGVIVGVGWMEKPLPASKVALKISELERSLGNYDGLRWAYHIANPVPLFEPVEFKGSTMLFSLQNRDLERFLVKFYRERFPSHDGCQTSHRLCSGGLGCQTLN